jgi:hypothetical protein
MIPEIRLSRRVRSRRRVERSFGAPLPTIPPSGQAVLHAPHPPTLLFGTLSPSATRPAEPRPGQTEQGPRPGPHRPVTEFAHGGRVGGGEGGTASVTSAVSACAFCDRVEKPSRSALEKAAAAPAGRPWGVVDRASRPSAIGPHYACASSAAVCARVLLTAHRSRAPPPSSSWPLPASDELRALMSQRRQGVRRRQPSRRRGPTLLRKQRPVDRRLCTPPPSGSASGPRAPAGQSGSGSGTRGLLAPMLEPDEAGAGTTRQQGIDVHLNPRSAKYRRTEILLLGVSR